MLYTAILYARVIARLPLVIIIVLLFGSFTASAHFGSKGPFGGTVSCAITQDSLVYIGTASGGVFESTTNALTTWRARPVGLTSGKISALAHSGSYLFAATADSGIFIFNGYVGADRYWNKINTGLSNLKLRSLLALDSITLLAGTEGSGLFKTTNKGASWTAINSPALNTAAITGMVRAGNRIILLTLDKGLFVSSDNGATWADFNDANTLNIAGATSVSYNAATDVVLVSNASGLFAASSVSTTNAVAYMAAGTGLPSGIHIRSIANNGTDWLIGTDQGVYTTPAASISWVSANNGLPGNNITAVAASYNRLLAGVAGEGIYKAASGTFTWTVFNTSFNNPVTRTMAAAGDSLIVAVTDKGVYVSKDLATTYKRSNTGLNDSLSINDIAIAGMYMLAATNGGVYISQDSGNTWTTANIDLPGLHITKLFIAANVKYAVNMNGNIFESFVSSDSWRAIQDGLPSGVMPTSMTFYDGKLILGTAAHGVYIRNQASGNWQASNTGLTNLHVTSVTASGNRIFAGTSGSGVFVSDVQTISWQPAAPVSINHTTMIGLNGSNIQAMASNAGYVYASYKGGLVATSDNGQTWIAGGNQFNLPSFTDVNKICFVSTRVFVPTEHNALYSNALSELPLLDDTLILSRETAEVENAYASAGVSVTSNRSWTVSVDQTWITGLSAISGKGNGYISVSVAPNPGPEARVAVVTITAGAISENFTITQRGITTAVAETEAVLSGMSIYPNPSKGVVTVDLTAASADVQHVSVYDITGKLISEIPVEAASKQLHIRLSQQPGFYFVLFTTNKGVAIRKIAVQ
jgi:photosystem II stability/assembly factor-like uncharacterized protein